MITALLIFTLISITGISLLGKLLKENRLFILIPSGMLLGISLYIFLLNLMFNFLPGEQGIIFSTVLMAIIAGYFFTKYKLRLPDVKIIPTLILPFIIMMAFLYFIQARMETILPVADSTIQWAYAASFAKGNYPLMTPWQPDIIPTYHMGAYFFEGAIHLLSGLPWLATHTLINIFFVLSAILMATFLLWENKYSFKNLWLVFASLFSFIAFGIVAIAIPNNLDFFSLSNAKLEVLSNLLMNLPQKGTAGAALVDFNSLSYLPARSISIGLALLLLYFFIANWKNAKWKIIFTSLILSTIALIEESAFLPLFLILLATCFISFIPKVTFQKQQRKSLLVIAIITISLITLQGGLITNVIKHSKNSAFNITLPTKGSRFFEKVQKIKNDNILITTTNIGAIPYAPNPLVLLIPAILFGLIKKERVLFLIGGFSVISILTYLLVEYKYDLSNNIRFYNFGYISAGLSFGYFIFLALKRLSYLINLLILLLLLPSVIIPTLAPEIIKQSHALQKGREINIAASVWSIEIPNTAFEQISKWASINLPANSRLLVLGNNLTPESSIQFQFKGLYTIFGPQEIRVLRQEPGIEFFDLSLTLNPSLLKKTNTQYIYIESHSLAYKQLPQFRKDDLENNKYFEVLQSIESMEAGKNLQTYKLYKINPEFFNLIAGGKEIEEGTLWQLNKLIPSNASVYISDYGDSSQLDFWYRMAVILALKDKQLVRNPHQTDYMAIETYIPYKSPLPDQTYDYLVLSPTDKPKIPAQLVWSNIFASVWKSDFSIE